MPHIFSTVLLAPSKLDFALTAIISAVAAIGAGFSAKTPSQRPFYLTDPAISLPYAAKDTVSIGLLVVLALIIPAVLSFSLSLLVVPSSPTLRDAPFALIWRRKIWEWNVGWMNLGLALAASFTATQGLKDLIGKPRPDLVGRCDPDQSKISTYAVGGLGYLLQGAPTYATYEICRKQSNTL